MHPHPTMIDLVQASKPYICLISLHSHLQEPLRIPPTLQCVSSFGYLASRLVVDTECLQCGGSKLYGTTNSGNTCFGAIVTDTSDKSISKATPSLPNTRYGALCAASIPITSKLQVHAVGVLHISTLDTNSKNKCITLVLRGLANQPVPSGLAM